MRNSIHTQKFVRCTLIAGCLLFAGCSRYYYSPNGVNVPLLSHAGQVHLNYGNGSDGDAALTDLQFGFSPLEHFGIMGGYSAFVYKEPSYNAQAGNVDARAHLFEIGGGYYSLVDRKGLFLFDVYTGVGRGALFSDVNMKALRVFMQPGIALRSKIVEVSLNWRLCDVMYNHLDANGYTNDYLKSHNLMDQFGRTINNKSYIFSEPALTVRAGYKGVKAEAQLVMTSAVSNVPWLYNSSTTKLGISFLINGYKAGKLPPNNVAPEPPVKQ